MPRRARKPYTPPPQGDIGPDTAAQRAGAVILTIREDNGAAFRRKRRDHALDIMYAAGKLTDRQHKAGMILFDAHCETQLSPASAFTKEPVDSTPDFSALILRAAERSAKFGRLYYAIPAAMRGPVSHVAVCGLQLMAGNEVKPPYSADWRAEQSHRAMLQVGLDILANGLRL